MSYKTEYNKARRNALSRYNKLLNKGYAFDKNPIPSIPKKITEASIRRLNKLTSKELREKALYGVDTETGKILTPREAYGRQRELTYKRQSEVQKALAKERWWEEVHAENILQRRREKGETHKQFIEDARAREYYEELKLEREREEWEKSFQKEVASYSQDEIDEFISIPPEQVPFETKQKLTEEQYDLEIANAYDSGEYELAKDLEEERDYFYKPDAEEVTQLSYEDRFRDAIEELGAYSPELADKMQESFDYFMSRKYGEGFETGLTDKQLTAFETALANLEDRKYKSNAMALYSIYANLDKAINSRHHSKAERMAFFGRLRSGDFQYE